MAEDESLHLIEDPCSTHENTCASNNYNARLSMHGRRQLSFMTYGLLVLGYPVIIFMSIAIAKNQYCTQRSLIYSPARDAIQFEKQVFYSHLDNNPFVGPPRPALDDAWHQLLKNMHIRLSEEEMKKHGGRSLQLADGSGYIGSLEVYHDLHCLKRIRHYLHREIYFPNITEKEWAVHTFHTEHCLEHFRELVMCRGDTALTTFYYRNHKKAAKLLVEHECINWNKLEDWASQRAIDISAPGTVLSEEESEHFCGGLEQQGKLC